MSTDRDMDIEFGELVDELKHEVGCIATFFNQTTLRAMINAMKTTGPSLDPERYDLLATDAMLRGDRASAIGFLLMAECTDAIDQEAIELESKEKGSPDLELEDTYHPVDRPLFRTR
jgi:hypothetical protein